MAEEKINLVVMRAFERESVYPAMDYTHRCHICKEAVGIFPSGLSILHEFGTRVQIVCRGCYQFTETNEVIKNALFYD